MKGMIGRLVFAAVLSLVGIFSSLYWYQSTEPKVLAINDKPIAYLNMGSKDIERKLMTRVVWQLLKNGDPLYSGDAVRTPTRGSGTVTFLDSETVVELESDSLIVLNEASDGVTMNLISGGLLVRSAGKTEQNKAQLPKIKAGNAQVALSAKASELSLNVNAAGAGSIAVTKGEVKSVGKSGEDTVLKQGSAATLSDKGFSAETMINILGPQPHAVIDIGTEGQQAIDVSWQPLDADVTFAWGKDRTKLERLTSSRSAGASGRMQIRLPVGEYYWQLLAFKPGSETEAARSLVQKLQVISIRPPLLIKPSPDENISMRASDKTELALQWAGAPYFEAYELQISSSPDFTAITHRQRLSGLEASWPLEKPGSYHWRVVGFSGKDQKGLSSKPFRFTVDTISEIKAPVLLKPDDQLVHAMDSAESLQVSWRPVPEAKQYRLLLKKRRVEGDDLLFLDKVLAEPNLVLKDLTPGLYTWSVRAEGQGTSAWSEPRLFRIKEVGRLNWTDGEAPQFFFDTQAPSVSLKWQKVKSGSYLLRYASADGSWDKAPYQAVKSNEVQLPLEAEGRYRFQVELRDDFGEVIARSSERPLEIKPIPPLPAPRPVGYKGQPLQAANDGSISLSWRPVAGALTYQIGLEDMKTGETRRQTIAGQQVMYQGLKPGRYRLHTLTVNKRELPGSAFSDVLIEVPQTSNIQAPKVKKINIR